MRRSWVTRSLGALAALTVAVTLALSPAITYAGGVPHTSDQGDDTTNLTIPPGALPQGATLLGPTVTGCITGAFMNEYRTPTLDLYNAAAGNVYRIYLNTTQARDALYSAGVGRCVEATGVGLSDSELSASSGRVM